METLAQRIEARWSQLRASERTAASYLAQNPSAVLFQTASELAKGSGTSDATVVRTARALGYGGLPDLKRHVSIELTRAVDPASRLEDTIAHARGSADGPVATVLADAEETQAQLRTTVDEAAVEAAVSLLHEARQVIAWGLGTSATAARYAAERLGRAGLAARHLDHTGFALANELITLRGDELLLLFVPGRRHPDLFLLLSAAHEVGARSILASNSHGPEVRSQADLVIDLPHSTTKITTELLTEVLLVDMLANAHLARHPDEARQARRRLTAYRQRGAHGETDVPRAP